MHILYRKLRSTLKEQTDFKQIIPTLLTLGLKGHDLVNYVLSTQKSRKISIEDRLTPYEQYLRNEKFTTAASDLPRNQKRLRGLVLGQRGVRCWCQLDAPNL